MEVLLGRCSRVLHLHLRHHCVEREFHDLHGHFLPEHPAHEQAHHFQPRCELHRINRGANHFLRIPVQCWRVIRWQLPGGHDRLLRNRRLGEQRAVPGRATALRPFGGMGQC